MAFLSDLKESRKYNFSLGWSTRFLHYGIGRVLSILESKMGLGDLLYTY